MRRPRDGVRRSTVASPEPGGEQRRRRRAGSGEGYHTFSSVPGCRNGAKPHGGFSVIQLLVPSKWVAGAAPSTVAAAGYDAAMAVAHPASDGRTVANVVGSRRAAFTQPRKGQFTDAFGYPHANSATPFKGARTVDRAGPVRAGDPAAAGHAVR
ncbi:hypothetical protein [Streptomyces celluloflavus]|uniref:hypothetical protein n=1 Tax=Streptomyces celluloflavus TaxID=58344 RepID=UPI003460E80A|nr:hypothetical protein OG717_01540 [Streptomyces celluloflavus]